MRVTEKGQVTIPKNIRRHLGIGPGSEVEFSFAENGALLTKVERTRDERSREAHALIQHLLRRKGTMNLGGLSPDEFYRMLRD